MDRIILHCDCNSFFASVEMARDPSLRDVPMAVAGDEAERHGIILAKNERAKKYGVATAETIREAKTKCPELVLVSPHYADYVRYSSAVRRIYERYTDQIEPFGMDEAWLDVTASRALFGDGKQIADDIKETVKREIGITLSVGVSFNKVFAKLGSDYKKPDAVTVIDRENFRRIVYPLPVTALLFVGRQTENVFRACNIRTIGDLAAISPEFLAERLGKAGETLSAYARGEDNEPVASAYEKTDAKSVGSGMTFRHDLTTEDEIRLGIATLAEDVAARLRRAGMRCTTVSLAWKDPSLRTVAKQKTLSPATDLSREIADAAFGIFRDHVRAGKPIRALTVTAMQLVKSGEDAEQIGFFDDLDEEKRKKTGKLESAVDRIRSRFGNSSVTSGAAIGNDIGVDVDRKGERHSREK